MKTSKYSVRLLTLCLILNVIASTTQTQFEGKIIGGTSANEINDFAVRIVSAISSTSGTGYLSTGVAITRNHVVTVGQAIYGFRIWYIGHGSIHVSEQYESISTDATVHPKYDAIFLHNNIGVIRVPNDISSTIPITSQITAGPVFGFGVINDVNDLPSTLQHTMLFSFNDNTVCIQAFNEFVIRSDNLCSVALHSGPSHGDQGGPVTNNQFSSVYGIVSFWSTDGITILVNLYAHLDFINDQLY